MAICKRTRFSNRLLDKNLDVIKRKKTEISTRPNWSSMHPDLLDNILNFLKELKDKIQVKHTCSSWFSVTKSHIRLLIEKKKRSSPMFLISGNIEEEDETQKVASVFSLEDKVQNPLLHNILLDSCCIGSSGGWLFLLTNFENLCIFHPTFGLKFSLPPIQSFQEYDYVEKILKHLIKKSILLGDPFLEKDFGVAVIYGGRDKLAFCKNGDTKWTELDGSPYCDIIYHDNSIFALTYSCYIEKYMISDVPRKVMKIKASYPNNIAEFKNSNDLYTNQFYLLESKGDLILVVRCIGNFVYSDSEVIREEDLIEAPYKYSICPYKTTNFYIYKLNFKKTTWEELSNLDDQMLFIGGNQSFSLSANKSVWGKENSIYFTDDNWDQITIAEEGYDFGGHDMGIFHMTERRFEEVYVCDTGKMDPAFWVLQS